MDPTLAAIAAVVTAAGIIWINRERIARIVDRLTDWLHGD